MPDLAVWNLMSRSICLRVGEGSVRRVVGCDLFVETYSQSQKGLSQKVIHHQTSDKISETGFPSAGDNCSQGVGATGQSPFLRLIGEPEGIDLVRST